MGIFDTLAKLGILRSGAKAGTYKNAAERPTEFMMDDVYNADRDLIAQGKVSGKPDTNTDDKPDDRQQ